MHFHVILESKLTFFDLNSDAYDPHMTLIRPPFDLKLTFGPGFSELISNYPKVNLGFFFWLAAGHVTKILIEHEVLISSRLFPVQLLSFVSLTTLSLLRN